MLEITGDDIAALNDEDRQIVEAQRQASRSIAADEMMKMTAFASRSDTNESAIGSDGGIYVGQRHRASRRCVLLA